MDMGLLTFWRNDEKYYTLLKWDHKLCKIGLFDYSEEDGLT